MNSLLNQSGLAGLSPIKKIISGTKILLCFTFPLTTTAPNRQCNSTLSATELGFLLGSTAVFLLLENCDLEARRRMHARVPLRTGLVFYAVALGGVRGTGQIGFTAKGPLL